MQQELSLISAGAITPHWIFDAAGIVAHFRWDYHAALDI